MSTISIKVAQLHMRSSNLSGYELRLALLCKMDGEPRNWREYRAHCVDFFRVSWEYPLDSYLFQEMGDIETKAETVWDDRIAELATRKQALDAKLKGAGVIGKAGLPTALDQQLEKAIIQRDSLKDLVRRDDRLVLGALINSLTGKARKLIAPDINTAKKLWDKLIGECEVPRPVL